MEKAYHIFLMIELAKCCDVIAKDLEYDSQWDKGQELYATFEKSQFNDAEKSEYDCIVEYLTTDEPTVADRANAESIVTNLEAQHGDKVAEVVYDLLGVKHSKM